MNVLRSDSIGDDRARIIVLYIEVHAIFGTRAHEILNEIEAASRPHPAKIGVRILRLDYDILMQKDVTVEREVAEGAKPSRWIYQLISDDKGHRVVGLAVLLPTSSHRSNN